MDKIPVSTLQFAVYENKTSFLGISKVTLPDIKYLTSEISGAGIAGKIESILTGQLEAMTLGLEFSSQTENAMKLVEPCTHKLDLMVASQDENISTREIVVQADKHVFVVVPKSLSGGTIQAATPQSASGSYAVRYWAYYREGKKITEIDPMNGICIINGKDYMAKVNAALGR